MATESFKDFLTEKKRRKKRRGRKKRYGLDWRGIGGMNLSGEGGDGGGAVGESEGSMLNGALPGAFSANVLGTTQMATRHGGDMKRKNKKASDLNLVDWLKWRAGTEEEEEDPVLDDPMIDDPELGIDRAETEPDDDFDKDGDEPTEEDPIEPDLEVTDTEDHDDLDWEDPFALFAKMRAERDPGAMDDFDDEELRDPDEDSDRDVLLGDEEDDVDDEEPPTVGDLGDEDYDEDEAFGDEYGFDPEQRKEMGFPDELDSEEEEEDMRGEYDDEFDIDADSFHKAMQDSPEYDEEGAEVEDPDEDELDFEKDEEPDDDMAAYMNGDAESSDDAMLEPGDAFGQVVSWWRENPVAAEVDPVGDEEDYDEDPDAEFDDELDAEEEPDGEARPRFRDMVGYGDEESDEGEFGDDVEDDEDFTVGRHGEEEAEAVGMSTAGRGVQVGAPGSVGGGQTAFAGAGPAPKGPTKIDRARMLFQQLINRGDMTRADIIAQFVERLDTTESTAVSYYERLAKEAGLTGDDAGADAEKRQAAWGDSDILQRGEMQTPADTNLDMGKEVPDSGDPNRAGYIRTVDNAHLVFKRQNEEGTFEELWSYNTGDDMKDELKIRRAILAGTDIPQGKTRSEDGSQSYSVTTMGNAQLVHVTGLRN